METYETEEQTDYSPFEEKFFEQVRSGKEYQHFLNVASQLDCAIIRSILGSADIPNYTEGEHTNGIYGGATNLLNNLFHIKLFILTEDYDEALMIVTDFIKNKIHRLQENSDEKLYMKMLEVLAAPYTISSKQDFLGISIMEKKKTNEKKNWWQKIWGW